MCVCVCIRPRIKTALSYIEKCTSLINEKHPEISNLYTASATYTYTHKAVLHSLSYIQSTYIHPNTFILHSINNTNYVVATTHMYIPVIGLCVVNVVFETWQLPVVTIVHAHA